MKRFRGCDECSRLWDEFAATMYRVLRLRGKLEVAVLDRDQKREDLLAPQLRVAEQDNIYAGIAMERHEGEAHGVSAAVHIHR